MVISNKPILLLRCAGVFGIIFTSNRKSFIARVLMKIYVLLFLVLILSIYVYNYASRTVKFSRALNSVVLAPAYISAVILYLMNFYVTIKFNFGGAATQFHAILEKILQVEEIIFVYKRQNRSAKNIIFLKFIVPLFTLHIISTITDSLNTFFNHRLALRDVLVDNILRFRLGIVLLLVCYIAQRIRTALRQVNHVLVHISEKEKGLRMGKYKKIIFFANIDLVEALIHVSKMYTILLKCVDIFNQIYGWSVFLLNIYAISFFMVIININRMQASFSTTAISIVWTSTTVSAVLVS